MNRQFINVCNFRTTSHQEVYVAPRIPTKETIDKLKLSLTKHSLKLQAVMECPKDWKPGAPLNDVLDELTKLHFVLYETYVAYGLHQYASDAFDEYYAWMMKQITTK